MKLRTVLSSSRNPTRTCTLFQPSTSGNPVVDAFTNLTSLAHTQLGYATSPANSDIVHATLLPGLANASVVGQQIVKYTSLWPRMSQADAQTFLEVRSCCFGISDGFCRH